jgi:hypothetical protein
LKKLTNQFHQIEHIRKIDQSSNDGRHEYDGRGDTTESSNDKKGNGKVSCKKINF